MNPAEADRDSPQLLAVPARVRFLSMEPLLGAVDILKWLDPFTCADCGFHGNENDAGSDGCEKCGELFGSGPNCEHCGADDQSAKRSCPRCGSHRSFERDHGFKFDSEKRLIDWVIVGGESGPQARPMHPDWARSLRDQCAAAGVPFLFKQWGEHTAHAVDPDGANPHLDCIDAEGRECALSRGEDKRARGEPWSFLPPWPGRGTWGPDGIPSGVVEVRQVGKKAAGRLLDGIEHNGFPEVAV